MEGRPADLCPRLVDYLCIVGSSSPHHPGPQLLARYPLTDHQDFPLPRDMVYFCQPDGCHWTYSRRQAAKEKTTFVFTLTDKDSGITRFGVCLNFYRGLEKRAGSSANLQESKRRSWTQRSDQSYDSAFYSDSKNCSAVGPSDSERDEKNEKAKESRPGFDSIFQGDVPSWGGGGRNTSKGKRREGGRSCDPPVRNQSLTSLCLISSHPFFSNFRECLLTLKKLVQACSSSNGRWRVGGKGGKGSDSVWAVLAGEGVESASSFLLHDVRELETWILRLLSAPVPVSGLSRLELEVVDRRYGPLLLFAFPDLTRFSLSDFPLHLPLELLGVELTLQVVTLVLLERKVILHSRDLNALSISILSLTSLIYPLQYMFPVIPILPTSMPGSEQLLLAPTPYIIGLPASFLKHNKLKVIPDDVWMVDLDAATIKPPANSSSDQTIPPLPQPEGDILKSHLKQMASLLRVGQELDMTTTAGSSLVFGNDVDSVDIACRVAFVKFFNSANVLGNFSEHTRTLRLYPRPVVAFQSNSFLRSRLKFSPFTALLAQSQAVEFYGEWLLVPSNLTLHRVHTGITDPTVIGDKFKWYAHNLEPVSFIVWDNLSSLNTALRSLQEAEIVATDESGSDSDGGSSSSSFSSVSEMGAPRTDPDRSHDQVDRAASLMSSGLNPDTVYEPPKSLQPKSLRVEGCSTVKKTKILRFNIEPSNQFSSCSSDSALCLPGTTSDSETSPGQDKLQDKTEDVFTSESENSSVVTTRTVRRVDPATGEVTAGSPTTSHSFGSNLSLTVSEGESSRDKPSKLATPSSLNFKLKNRKQSVGSLTSLTRRGSNSIIDFVKDKIEDEGKFSVNVKFPRSRLSNSSSSGESRKVSDSRQSSEEIAHELFTNIEQFTKQAKKAAESIALESSVSKVIAGKYTGKETTGDRDNVRNVVDDFKTAIKSLAESNDESAVKDKSEKQSVDVKSRTGAEDKLEADREREEKEKINMTNNNPEQKKNNPVEQSLQFAGNYPEDFSHQSSRYELLPNIDMYSIASHTQDFIGGLLGGSVSTPASLTASPVSTPRDRLGHQGPFNRGRRALVENSPLIRHPTNLTTPTIPVITGEDDPANQTSLVNTETNQFLKEVVDQVTAGDGVGWLKLSRLRKLLEEEQYRTLVLSKLQSSIESKVAPDDHIEDVCLNKSVYKGVLKVLLAVINGLEVSLNNFGVGGLSSAFRLLEISHTHFWSKDLLDNVQHGLSGPSSTEASQYGSRDNLDSLTDTFNNTGEQSLEPPRADHDSSQLFRELILKKKQLLFGRLTSFDSESEDVASVAASDTGSMTTNPAFQRGGRVFSSIRSAVSDNGMDDSYNSPSSSSDVWHVKSNQTSGFRYRSGTIMSTITTPSPDTGRYYVFEGILAKSQSSIWRSAQFWEDIFLDSVAQEREAAGMDSLDSGPSEMMERYRSLSQNDKKRLEHDEDRLLSTMLYNLVAFMIMMRIDKMDIKKIIRRLLGKSHIGLIYSQEINLLLEKISQLSANDIDLKQLPSRQVNRQTFTVHSGTEPSGDLLFMEVRDDGLVLRSVSGVIADRWFFERLVNMTYSPKNRVLCLWRRNGGQTQLHKYYTAKCRDLYYCIKAAMERAAARGVGGVTPGMELGGEFPVQDIQSGEGGLLQVCMEGVGLLFSSSKFFVRLEHIRKCFTMKEGIFVLEEYVPKSRKIVQRKYKSAMADQICYAVLCVFSYVAAGHKKTRPESGHTLMAGSVSPRGPKYSSMT